MTPQLRFPEFTDVWQVRKLGDITQINPRVGSLPDVFVYIDLDSVKRGTLLKQNRISKIGSPSRAQRLLSRDDIIYQTVRPYQKNNFYFDKAGDYVASTGYAQIRAREGYYPRFVYTLLHTSTFVNKVLVRSTGTNYPAINSNDLAKVKVHTPSKPEQEKIADFLTAVDERIRLQEQKLAKLEQYKRGVMQQIFSQKIRFKDENGNEYPEWEEKKLGELVEVKTGNLNVDDANPEGKYHFFDRSIDIKRYDEYSFDNEALIYSGEGSEFLPRYFKGKYGLHQRAYTIFNPKNLYMKFLYYFMLTQNKHFLRTAVGTTVKSLRMDCFTKCTVSLPNGEEQQKIATFLTALDDKITAEKSKLTAAKQFKKALLQRMFV